MENNTTSLNSTEPPTSISETKMILSAIFICIVMLVTIIGNSLVILCVFYYPRLRGRTNYLIVSLAVADWLVGTLSLPFKLAQTVDDYWEFGETCCQFWIWVDMLCSAASILSLMAISFDRLIAVVEPLKYEERMRPRHVYAMIAFIWCFALICASLSLTKWKGVNVVIPEPRCSLKSKEYITFVSIAAFFVPLAVVLVNYGIIFRIAMHHAYRLQRETRSLATNYRNESTDANHNPDTAANGCRENKRSIFSFRKAPQKSSERSPTLSLIKQLKATKTLAIVIGVFAICWSPFFVIFLLFQYKEEAFLPPQMSHRSREILIIIFVEVLPVANSAANPLIYSCFNVEFRKAFKRIIAKILKRKKSWDNADTSFTAVPTSNFQRELDCSST
ncbi:tyramine receptor 1-like [Dendronephthya gigantea]|uniref:tyramine receptor 1-like n=1 Tax=Dendronephthya gigantea TaxID=151771 RepID=UPI00106C5310|nr:tyramine receptor 1-like [Dendronephthya gigantea]XP_028391814.1 tyramine receptor 1-like [Dendronephthya gigantea]XP_028391815.1 tyramine receptor 1-like [Dendronephthya gigantea]